MTTTVKPKTIDSLIPDIHQAITERKGDLIAFSAATLGADYRSHVADLITPSTKERVHNPKALHASKIGKNCLRQMWYAQFMPDKAEPYLPHTLIKFTFGDLVEEFALDLVSAAGHTVTRRQERIEFPIDAGFTVSGRIDAVIDGFIVDVKSTSPYSYSDWAGKPLTAENDSFGYRWQLHTYGKGLPDNEGINKDRGYLLLMDKQNGHIGLSWVDFDWQAYDLRLKIIAKLLSDEKNPPQRMFHPEEKDKLSNLKLTVECSYCDYRLECWKEHDVTGVLRSGRVVWLVAKNEGEKVRLKPGELKLNP